MTVNPQRIEHDTSRGDDPSAPPPASRRKKKLWKDLARVAGVIALFGGAAFVLQLDAVQENLFSIQNLRRSLNPDDSLSSQLNRSLLFILFGSLLITLGMPRLWISTVAGMIYGAVTGTALAMIASLAGAMGTYFIGRSILRGVVRRRLGNRVNIWANRFHENAFMWTLYARLFPVANASLTSIICGCCRVKLSTYFAANLLGFLPLTIVFAVFGSAAAKGNVLQLVLGSILFLAAVAGQWFYSRRSRRRLDSKG